MYRRHIIFIISSHVHFFTADFNVLGSLVFQNCIIRRGMAIRIIVIFPSTRRCEANGKFQLRLLALISICERIVFAPSEPTNYGVLFWQAGRLQSGDECEPLLEG